MKMGHLIGILSQIGASSIDIQRQRDELYLNDKGWICLGVEAITGQVHWTNLERGLDEGGPVTFYRAFTLQRTADAIAHHQSGEGLV